MAVSRTIPASLRTHIDGSETNLATLWTITREDGVVLTFTDHDTDIVIGGTTYRSAVGYERTSIEGNANLAVGGLDVKGILNSNRIAENDLRGGRFDRAAVEITLIDWTNPTGGEAIVQTGTFGEIIYSAREGMFSTELRDISQAYSQRIIESFVIPCRADIGDARCTLPVLPDLLAPSTAYVVGDVVRVRKPVEDVMSIHAPGVVDDDDDSQYAAVGTIGSDATAADATQVKNLAGNFRFNPIGGVTQNPSNSFVSWPDASQYAIGMQAFTIEMWFYLEAWDQNEGPILASDYTSTGDQRSWLVFLAGSGDNVPGLQFIHYLDGQTATLTRLVVNPQIFTPEIDKFYHLVVERDKQSHLRIFVDGKIVADSDFALSLFDTTAGLRLGMFDNSAGGNRHFQGSIEDFRMTVGDAIHLEEFEPPTAPLASTFNDTQDVTEDFSDTNYTVTVAGTTGSLGSNFFGSFESPADTGAGIQIDTTAPSTFTRITAGSFLDDGFEVNQVFDSTLFTAGANNDRFRIVTVTATVITVTSTAVVTETGTGDENLVQVNSDNGVEFNNAVALRIAGRVFDVVDGERNTFIMAPPAGGGALTPPFAFINPGWETGTIFGWSLDDGAVAIVTQLVPFRPSFPHSGTYALRQPSSWSGSNYAEVSQTLNVAGYAASIDPGDKTITARFWYWGDSGAAGRIWVNFHFFDADDMLISVTAGTHHSDAQETWKQKSQTNTIPTLTRSIKIAVRGGDGTSEPYTDDWTLETTAQDLAFPDDEFNYGVLTWDSGLNAGLSMEVKDYVADSKQINLYQSMPFPITVDDTFGIHIGCSREASRCKVLDNIINHRGFRFIPGDTKINTVPALA